VGLEVTRQGPGYHDEPLKGKWVGHRSIRLSKSYRAIYTVRHDGTVEFARVEAVSKHEYQRGPVATRKSRLSKSQKLNACTTAFLQSLSSGPLTFGQLLSAIREADEQSLSQFASRLGISRQHLHQLETGRKRVSPERAVRFAGILGHSEVYFVQLALQDLVEDAGVSARVEVKVA
jgi:DNA-binding transcriptional regulator YiaG